MASNPKPEPLPFVEGFAAFSRDLCESYKPRPIVDPTFKAHKLGPNAQRMMDKLTAPIVNDEPENMDDTGPGSIVAESGVIDNTEVGVLVRQMKERPTEFALRFLNLSTFVRAMHERIRQLEGIRTDDDEETTDRLHRPGRLFA